MHRPNEGYRDPRRAILTRPSDLPTASRLPTSDFVNTSVAQYILRCGALVHGNARMGAIIGPPGIGKSVALTELQRRNPHDIVYMVVARGAGTPVRFMRSLCTTVSTGLHYERGYYPPAGFSEQLNYIKNVLADRAGESVRDVSTGNFDPANLGRLTVLIDEAQNAHADTMELVRSFNDREGCLSPIPFGFLFVGNHTMSLAPGDDGRSVLSRAMADRLLFNKTLGYGDVTDDDMRLFAEAQAELTEDGMAYILEMYARPQAVRSLRTLQDALVLAQADAGDEPVDAGHLAPQFEALRQQGRLLKTHYG